MEVNFQLPSLKLTEVGTEAAAMKWNVKLDKIETIAKRKRKITTINIITCLAKC